MFLSYHFQAYPFADKHFTVDNKIDLLHSLWQNIFFHSVKQNTRNENWPLFTIVILVTLGFDESHAMSVLQ